MKNSCCSPRALAAAWLFFLGMFRAIALDSALPPGANFDLTHWYLTLPESGAPTVSASRLTDGYTNRQWFYTGADGAMMMWAPVNGGTTSGSSFPRSELRELLDPGDVSENWTAPGRHVLEGQCKIHQLPSTGRTVVAQIHGYVGSAPVLVLIKTVNGMLNAQFRLRVADAVYEYVPLAPLVLGEMITYRIEMVDGLLTVTINGASATRNILADDAAWGAQTFYFKAGSYPQDNAGDSAEGSLVGYYSLRVTHGTVSEPVAITTQPADLTVNAGANASLRVVTRGTPPVVFQWFKDGAELPGATAATLAFNNVSTNDAGAYHVVITNAFNAVTSRVARVTVLPVAGAGDLADALDTAGLAWTVSGAPAWFPQSAVTHDGADAMQSGAIGHSQTTALQTTVTGPGVVGFWWKVSSEPSNDRLLFYIGTSEKSRITGNSAWQWKTFIVSSGPQILKWTYSKNSSKTNGLDAAWLDEVRYVPNSPASAPVIAVQPVGTNVDAGGKAVFTVAALGSPTLKYQWQSNGTNLVNNSTAGVSGATAATLTLASVQPWRAGNYTVIVSNTAAAVTSAPALLVVPPVLTLAEALDTPALVWTTSGTPAWIGQTNLTFDGTDAARSGAIADEKSCSMQTTVIGPGTLTFLWKVSCETNSDRLRFYLNGSEQARISGEVDWQSRTFALPSGTQTLKWTYSKDDEIALGQDRAWVDAVQFTPPAAPAPSLVPVSVPVLISTAGKEVVLTWSDMPGHRYEVFYKENLADEEWLEFPVILTVEGSTVSATDERAGEQRFYQVLAK